MQHAAVVARLMESDLILLLEDPHPETGSCHHQSSCGGQSDDAPADDEHVGGSGHVRGTPMIMPLQSTSALDRLAGSQVAS